MHHSICVIGMFWALNATHQRFIANATIIYESTGLGYNVVLLLKHLRVSRQNWFFLTTYVNFVCLFTYFRMYLGNKICIKFWFDDKVKSIIARLILVVFQLINLYWYGLIVKIMMRHINI